MSSGKMNVFLAILYCDLNGSFKNWIKYCNTEFCFTICNSASNFIENDCTIQVISQENIFFNSYLKIWIKWYEDLRCQTNKINIRKKKFELFSNIIKCAFYSEETKNNMIMQFSKLQKSYMALNRFAYLWKYKHAHTSVITDLYLNYIDTSKDSTFVLFQNNAKFTFRISEIVRIISGALCHNFEANFEIKSEKPKNPYNKIEFKIHDLYNIYLHIAFNTKMNMPTLLQLWFKENFDYKKMCIKNRVFIEETCVRNFVNTINVSNKSVFLNLSKNIIPNNEYTKIWIFDKDFPSEEIVKKLRPCLYDFYIVNYFDCDAEEKQMHTNNMSRILKNIYLEDPTFGTIKKKVEFDNKSSFRFDMKNENHSPFIFGANDSSQAISTNKKSNKRKKQDNKYRYNATKYKPQENRHFKYQRSAFHKDYISMDSFGKDSVSLSAKDDEAMREILDARAKGITVNDSIQMGFVNNGMPTNLEYKHQEIRPKKNWLQIFFDAGLTTIKVPSQSRIQEDKEEIIKSIATLFV